MYVITVDSVQDPSSESYDGAVGGAYVKCYFQNLDSASARRRASQIISENGWIPIAVTGEGEVDPCDYDEDDEEREFIDQANLDGECVVFHTWPLEKME